MEKFGEKLCKLGELCSLRISHSIYSSERRGGTIHQCFTVVVGRRNFHINVYSKYFSDISIFPKPLILSFSTIFDRYFNFINLDLPNYFLWRESLSELRKIIISLLQRKHLLANLLRLLSLDSDSWLRLLTPTLDSDSWLRLLTPTYWSLDIVTPCQHLTSPWSYFRFSSLQQPSWK